MKTKLGKNQEAVLKHLRKTGYWYGGCGWIWSTYSATTALMESLVKRGLARRVHVPASGFTAASGMRQHPAYNRYEPI